MRRPEDGTARRTAILTLAAHLSRAEYPRALMLALVGLSGTAGFLASAGMLAAGIAIPAVRYPLAALAGYAGFLGLVRLWLWWRRDERRDATPEGSDLPLDAAQATGTGSGSPFGGGGGFGGGGSSAGIDGVAGAGDATSAIDIGVDVDEGAAVLVPVAVVVALAAGLAAAGSVLWNAPTLLAEVMLDGAIATVVYRRVRVRGAGHWSEGVLRRTWKPMLAITGTLLALGLAIPWLVPGADSIGDLFR